MTKTDTVKMLAIIKAAYPVFFKDMDVEAAVELWHSCFKDEDSRIVAAAVKNYILTDTSGKYPTVGAIAEAVRRIKHPQEMGEHEAWAMIRKAVANGYYGYAEEYAKLPPMLQKLIGSATQLKDWATMDSDTFNSVVASNFRKWFTTAQMREREQAKLPADVRNVIGGLTDRYRLTEGQT